MHAVCETHAFRRAAAHAGMSENEIDSLVTYLAINPTAGDEMVGTGGCRKVRLAGRGKGKSGGYRTVTFFTGAEMPVFLLTVFSKGERADLTQNEKRTLKNITQDIVRTYRIKAKADQSR
jgi:hypothetical protein